jgi:excisionase family DNA binding protein
VNEILTVTEAASFLKKHPHTVRRWILAKKLRAKKIAAGGSGVFAILKNDLLEYVVSRSVKQESINKTRKNSPHPPAQEELPI